MRTALVTLTSGATGDARVQWRVPGARFADGTSDTSPKATVVVEGGAAVPVEVTVRPLAGGPSTVRVEVLQVAGSPWLVQGVPVVGRTVELERDEAGAALPDLRAFAPSGAVHALTPERLGSRIRVALTPDEPGVWTVGAAGVLERACRVVVLP